MTDFVIRDPVHGDIALHPHERRILDTPEMQRLRGIKQLGTAYLVYPGCRHTRFEHSLGTLFTATRILDALRGGGHAISRDDESLVRAAALVHDVSHIPFGHTFEDERKVFPRHDHPRRLRHFLFDGELGAVLQELGLSGPIWHLLTQGGTWQADVVAGWLDADLLDYLRRDALFTGLSQSYDDRIFRYFTIANGRLAMQLARRGIDRSDARSEIVHLLRMRYFLTERVYFHHAKVIAGAMISKAVELAVRRGMGEGALYGLSDDDLLNRFATEPWGELAQGVQQRRLLKRAYALSPAQVGEEARWKLTERYHLESAAREELERRLAEAAHVPMHQVIVYAPPFTTFKEAAVPVVTRKGLLPLSRMPGAPHDISSLEEQYRGLWRFYIFAPAEGAQRVGRAAEEVLGLRNELAGSEQDS